jgi:hypothetical protein
MMIATEQNPAAIYRANDICCQLDKYRPWLIALMARRPIKVAAIALANKIARVAWALMTRERATANLCRKRPEAASDEDVGKGSERIMQPAGRFGDRDTPF